ncbi:MAG: 5-(carboxyamino)imidazole ribonucleotide mutase [Oscillospiraceae bacterium]|nr:5-(carboxyamino)imidazole ribonucleotide mutase [Oscillospiraceae bacterium]
MSGKKVAVIMGADGDLPVMKPCITMLKNFGIEYEVRIISAHRTPYEAENFAKNAESNNFGAIIAAAGKAAHLAGVLAAYTILPVIAVPIKASALEGLDALLSMVQMPTGIPVATVAIDGAANAALLAVQILALGNGELSGKLKQYKTDMANDVRKKDAEISAKLDELLK